MNLYFNDTEIEFPIGCNPNRLCTLGSGTDILVSAGCSWTRGWGAVDEWGHSGIKYDWEDDKNFVQHNTFSGLVAKHLNLSAMLMLAIPGSNNDMQSRLIIEFIQNNRKKFNRIFVLWGITSHLRWELFSNNVNAPSMFMFTSEVPPGKDEERAWYLRRHWNEEFELHRQHQKIITLHAYLKMLEIEHLFFPVFESFNNHTMDLSVVDSKNFFGIDQNPNDMMNLWCAQEQIPSLRKIISNPFNNDDRQKLTPLIDKGYLAKTTAHPSAMGHQDIANKLIAHIDRYQSR